MQQENCWHFRTFIQKTHLLSIRNFSQHNSFSTQLTGLLDTNHQAVWLPEAAKYRLSAHVSVTPFWPVMHLKFNWNNYNGFYDMARNSLQQYCYQYSSEFLLTSVGIRESVTHTCNTYILKNQWTFNRVCANHQKKQVENLAGILNKKTHVRLKLIGFHLTTPACNSVANFYVFFVNKLPKIMSLFLIEPWSIGPSLHLPISCACFITLLHFIFSWYNPPIKPKWMLCYVFDACAPPTFD